MPQDAVIPVLNFVDRVPLEELQEVILPDFRRWIMDEWHINSPVYLISAKSSAPWAVFAEDEQPLHTVNQIDALKAYLDSSFSQTGMVNDRRVTNAEHLLRLLKHDCMQALDVNAEARNRAKELLLDLDRRAMQLLKEQPVRSGLPQDLSTLYTNLSQRWWGPVGWLMVIWSLLQRLGSFLGHLIHRDRLTLSLRGKIEQESLLVTASELSSWSARMEQIQAESWPPVVDALVATSFTNSIRNNEAFRNWVHTSSQRLTELWGLAYRDQLNRITEWLSHWLLQAILNAPILILVGWMAVQTVVGFINKQYLSLDYFRHSGITICIVWAVCFIVLQIIITISLRGALKASLRAVMATKSMAEAPLLEQLRALDYLEHLGQ